jgi:membrane protein DedA with SNARE-associated domain
MLLSDFTSFLGSAAGSPPLEMSVIILGTFILEDAATLLAAMQVAAGAVSLPLALISLYAGIILGDLGLYGVGRLSAHNRWARRLVPQRRRDMGHQWVSRRVIPAVLVARFVPGLRLPTYTTFGFLHAPFVPFALTATGATLLWTSGLFFVSLKLGHLMLHYLGPWRWAGFAVLGILILVAGRIGTRMQAERIGKEN